MTEVVYLLGCPLFEYVLASTGKKHPYAKHHVEVYCSSNNTEIWYEFTKPNLGSQEGVSLLEDVA